MALSGNKGEWSEPYVLLKLLAEKKLSLGDEKLKIVAGLVYPIITIIRKENNVTTEFSYDKEIVVIKYGIETLRIPITDFIEIAKTLFNRIKSSVGPTSYPDVEEFLNSINVHNMKAKSIDKSDITIQIHDIKTLLQPVLGFSIKSQLGSPSTLVNASGATNFTYRIIGENIEQEKIDIINAADKFEKRFDLLNRYHYTLGFVDVENEIFKVNLQTIDTHFPQILSEMLIQYYSSSCDSNLKSLVEKINQLNPIHYNLMHNHNIYELKTKRFLTDYALGMKAATVWKGIYDATGGYIIVRKDGELVCYHFYYKNQFEDYLLANTKFDTPSRSKHGYGTIYAEGGNYYIKLNLQIRFLI